MLFFVFAINIENVVADKTNNTSSLNSVSWSAINSWAEGIAPSIVDISGEHITINGYVTVSNSDIVLAGGTMSFGANSDGFNLTVNNGGLLVVEGNINFENKAMNLMINSGGTVLILGDFSSTNFIDIQDDGVLVVLGDMAFGGAQSTFDNSGTGNLYVGGNVTGNTDAENEDQTIEKLNDGLGHDDPDLFNLIVSSIAGMTITESSGSTIVTESGGTDTFDLVLDVEPEFNVVISVTSNNIDEFTVDKASLTFTTGNWNIAQTIMVLGVDDTVDDGDIVGSVTLSVDEVNSDNAYDLLDSQSISVTNQDDDTFGISVSAISNNTKEDATVATFTVVLDSEPTDNVELGVSSDDITEGTVSTSLVTFTITDWFIPQTVTIIGVNDDLDDGNVAFNVVLAAANSTDTDYNNLNPADVAVINEDDDTFGISVSAISNNTKEDATVATFTVVLDSEPTDNVELGVSSDDITEGTVSTSLVTFTITDWFIPQTVTIIGVNDDLDDGNVAFNVVLAAANSTDTDYNNLNPTDVAVINEDDDTFGISVSAISNNTKEDATVATFTVVLDSEPTDNVELGVSSDDITEGTVSTSLVTFTITDWFIPQTVTIIGVNDDLDDGNVAFNVVLAAANSTDTDYNNLNPADVAVINEDDDGNVIPVITNQAVIPNTNEDENISISIDHLTVSDTDNIYPDDFTLIVLGGENYVADGIVITPEKDFNGTLPVKVFVNDGQDDSNIFNFIVKVISVNDVPKAHPDAKEVEFGNLVSGNLLANDSDVDKNELLLNKVAPDIEGFTFEPNGDYKFENNVSIEEFILNYEICDDGIPSLCSTSTFTITIKDGDFDQDGIPDSVELSYDDIDGDGDMEYLDTDSDNDDIDDADEAGPNPAEPLDTDIDGLPDFVDFDSDADGKLDKEEGLGDCDNDTIANYIDEEDFCDEMIVAGAFSPNGDGKNDEWIIPGINEFPDNTVIIFNRWGKKVFQIDGYDNITHVWRGEINAGFHTGSDEAVYSTYYYLVDLRNGSKPMSGSILLVR